MKHFVTLTRSKDWRYVLINSTSKLSTEVRPHWGGQLCVAPQAVKCLRVGLCRQLKACPQSHHKLQSAGSVCVSCRCACPEQYADTLLSCAVLCCGVHHHTRFT